LSASQYPRTIPSFLELFYGIIYDLISDEFGGGERRVQCLVMNTEGKRPLERPRRRWEDNIKMDLQELRYGVWTVLSWLRIERWRALVNGVINFRVP
jgi:hypothetical protein